MEPHILFPGIIVHKLQNLMAQSFQHNEKPRLVKIYTEQLYKCKFTYAELEVNF